ncbi:BrnA antitoxin family protein [Novosphingobium kaempferiae]|uniref:BrnA antitoxin family protein n=1 Tax=Novosphingobium kaempferiae TaxID=2896849 RepID=UPI001E56D0AC|nr:BrnA antitoxin family protein [Novosphingobium kaempferiae]
MSKPKYTQADMDAVSDNPEWSEEDFAKAVPFAEAFPDLAKTIRRRGVQKAPTKVSTTIRLSPEVIAHFRSTGPGWQARIDDALKDWVAAHG